MVDETALYENDLRLLCEENMRLRTENRRLLAIARGEVVAGAEWHDETTLQPLTIPTRTMFPFVSIVRKRLSDENMWRVHVTARFPNEELHDVVCVTDQTLYTATDATILLDALWDAHKTSWLAALNKKSHV